MGIGAIAIIGCADTDAEIHIDIVGRSWRGQEGQRRRQSGRKYGFLQHCIVSFENLPASTPSFRLKFRTRRVINGYGLQPSTGSCSTIDHDERAGLKSAPR